MNYRQSVSDYFSGITQKVKAEILGDSDETILGTDADELIDYYYSRSALVPILIEDAPGNMEHVKEMRTVRSEHREEMYRGEGDISGNSKPCTSPFRSNRRPMAKSSARCSLPRIR